MNINNINDWMIYLSSAIINCDYEMVEELEGISRGWLQTDEDLKAQDSLIYAAYEAIER